MSFSSRKDPIYSGMTAFEPVEGHYREVFEVYVAVAVYVACYYRFTRWGCEV